MERSRIDATRAGGAGLQGEPGPTPAPTSGAVRTGARARRRSLGVPAPWRARWPAAAALLALAGWIGPVAGCRGEPTEEAANGLAPESFIEIMVALREAEREAVRGDSAAAEFERRKEEILAEHAVGDEDLRAFVRRHQGDFALMNRVWDSIAQRLRYVPDEPVPGEDLRIDGPR